MKAKGYFEKYEARLTSNKEEVATQAASELFQCLLDDFVNLCHVRHISSFESFYKTMKEVNNKWNAIVKLFEKKYKVSPILKDGFIHYAQYYAQYLVEKTKKEINK